jgi:hypothetical protein
MTPLFAADMRFITVAKGSLGTTGMKLDLGGGGGSWARSAVIQNNGAAITTSDNRRRRDLAFMVGSLSGSVGALKSG